MPVIHAAGTGILCLELELASKLERAVAKSVAYLVRRGDDIVAFPLGTGAGEQVELLVLCIETRYADADEAHGISLLPYLADEPLGDGDENPLVIDIAG